MKRNLVGTSSLVVLSLLLSAAGAYAQASVQAYVPFAFMVGTTQLPAGSYRITENDRNTVMIRGANTRTVKFALYRQDSPRNVSPKMVFHHFGNQYFLAEIWGDENRATIDFPASKPERQAQALEVASGPSNASKEVMIALK
jgi:hypothetical protein